ncbi:malto-oligosyltrehalose synthase [Nocardioides campestrisoli]|uniref:malto-oligosyltrehalose synthase n=1 Tax=Nocardioides campestrisoli TaxID=2736757 RepID=UPI00215A0217|nr:malto-oligosyltrehalose synthase [Nocardioides campestrisoli]
MTARRLPRSTYRLQITEEFDLLEAARTLRYLHELGADWVYLSPLLASETGSSHGYDVADHRAIDPSRGRASGLAALAAEAQRLGMGVLVDIVPNHVGIAAPWQNEWWWHVLTHGAQSTYAGAFDIDWEAGGGRLRIPVVGDDDLEEVDGVMRIRNLRVEAGELHYHDHRFPLAPESVPGLDPYDADPDEVHARQHYELVSWRRADTDLNYRRFFAVNTLAAIRVEEPEWFEQSHAEIRRWFDEGLVQGLRVDHPDGLREPAKYLQDLAALTGDGYVLVEKILEPGEQLPASWTTDGTTGYDVLALVDRVFVDPAGEKPLDALETRLRGGEVDWAQMVHDSKRAVADGILQSEVRRIAREVAHVLGDASPSSAELGDAVAELLACFEVYRSYLPEGHEHLDGALESARRHRPDLAPVLDVLAPVLADGAADPALRFQQTSGMVMAKGVEDTAFYRWARLTSLNEVGADPSVFAVSPGELHAAMADRQAHWPHAMTAASTHDTKRGEDTRARISVIAEVPEPWERALDRLLALVPVPDAGFANLLWQAVVGAWPASRERLHGYAEKAMREAGQRTTWTAPDEEFEAAVHRCVDAAFDDPEVLAVVTEVVDALAAAGWVNSLGAKLVGLTVPGVPDVYQGSELWEQSLVDPDNRRPVSFEHRADLLSRLRLGERPHVHAHADDDGAAKLLVTHLALTARRDHPEWFTGYRPLSAHGPAADHVLAFARTDEGQGAVTVATRLPVGLLRAGGWRDTTLALPPGQYVDLLTDRRVRPDSEGLVEVDHLLADYPVALLVPDTDPGRRGRFDVWAPKAESLELVVGQEPAQRVVEMERGADDWWHPVGPEPLGEVDYGYRVDGDEQVVFDPRARRLPDGVHGMARTDDPSTYAWTDSGWTGRQLAGSVIYELHVGTFTPEGTLDAAITRLDHLKEIGVDLVELLPVNGFNGAHNWGYDGVAWFTVHEAYGGPAAYRRFVDACHAAGLGVIQDVVYNHLGPSGNWLPKFGPYLAEGRNTWGDYVNLAEPEVRAYVLDNVRMWLEDFHVDGLRIDAVHALRDESPTHVLEEMAVLAGRLSAQQRRPLTLIAESDLNDPTLITPREAGGYGLDGQWSDDFHHAVHVALTGETSGYYADFAPLAALAKVCEKGFFHDGTWSSFRDREHGKPVDVEHMPAWRLVVCNQNHDQVGNRAAGDRLTAHLDDDQLAVAALLTLAGPFTPMLFQGEEWAASTPFAFFTSHPETELGRIVSEGRVKEFERMDWDVSTVPDPQDPQTFLSSTLDWAEAEGGRHAVLLEVYRSLAALRRELPQLTDPDMLRTSCEYDEDARWFVMHRGEVAVAVNFSDEPVTVDLGSDHVVRWATPAGATLVPGGVELPAHAGAVLLPLD